MNSMLFYQQIILYLPSLKDIKNFSLINKKCLESVKSLTITPYSLTKQEELSTLINFFSNLKLLYIASTTSRIKVKNLKKLQIPIIIENYSASSLGNSLFTNEKFTKFITKIRIGGGMLISVAKSIKTYVNLKTIILNEAINEELIEILKIERIEKCIIICGIFELKNILKKFDFKMNTKTQFIFFVEKYNK